MFWKRKRKAKDVVLTEEQWEELRAEVTADVFSSLYRIFTDYDSAVYDRYIRPSILNPLVRERKDRLIEERGTEILSLIRNDEVARGCIDLLTQRLFGSRE